MRTLEDVPPIIRGLLVVGPFLFLALDHLITGVRNTVLDLPAALLTPTHPPSDVRAATLRAAVNAYGDPSLMQVADAMVSSLSTREDLIVRRGTALDQPFLRGLPPGGHDRQPTPGRRALSKLEVGRPDLARQHYHVG